MLAEPLNHLVHPLLQLREVPAHPLALAFQAGTAKNLSLMDFNESKKFIGTP